VFDVFLITNKSIAGIFLGALLLFIIPFIVKQKKRGIFILLLLIITLLSILLFVSNSRAGWLGFAAGLIYILYSRVPAKKGKQILLAGSFCFLLLLIALLFYKSGSSSGRKHIYSISLNMWRDNWQKGIGLGKFKTQFNEYQANYFSLHDIDSKRALLADNTFYAFNDYLQWGIETGIIGFLVLVLLLYLTTNRIIFLQIGNGNKPILIAVTAAIICVAIAALVSYPLQIVTIQAVLLACLGIIAFYPDRKDSISMKQKAITFLYRGLIIAIASAFINNTWKAADRKEIEKEAFAFARSGYKIKAIQKYKQVVGKYPATGYNWFSYAQQLYYSNRLTEAIESLQNCKKNYVDNKVYKLKADIELELKRYEKAEKDYLRTIYMVPNRMGSRFDLLNFYVLRKDTTKAIYWANSILNMSVKVPSIKVDTMLSKTKSILERLKK
jgi:O-antigen ligase